MNLNEIAKQILPYLIELAESPPVQAKTKAVLVAILNVIEDELVKSIPYGLRTIARILRWIYINFKGVYLSMKFNLQRFADEETTTSTETTADTETVAAEVAADEAEATEDSTVTTGSVTITVQDGDGNPIEGATISYTVNSATCDGTTDSNGQLAVSDLPAGTYTFEATKDGYASGAVEVTVVAAETATGTITLTAETTNNEEETNVSEEIKDAAEEAATAAAVTALSSAISTAVDNNSGIITWATNEIARLAKEMGTTSDFYVKYVRNPIEIAALSAALAAATAGAKKALEELAEKAK